MSLFEYVFSCDIEDKNTTMQISDLLIKSNKFIYLTATQSLKNIRLSNEILSEKFSQYKTNDSIANLFSSNEFSQFILRNVIKKADYLSIADSRYILSKVIAYHFCDQKEKYNTYYEMRYDLFELFRLMMFYNVSISNEQIIEISHDFSFIEEEIFLLYKIYTTVTEEVLSAIRTGKENIHIKHILGDGFLKNTGIKGMDTLMNKQKYMIESVIKKVNAIVLDGFLFFNDMQKFIIKTAIQNQKQIYFIIKTFDDTLSNFIFENNIKVLADELGVKFDIPNCAAKKQGDTSGLAYIRDVFPTIPDSITPEISEKYSDGSIRIFEPFINREEELRFIVKDISRMLQESYTGDIAAVRSMVNNDIAIVTGIDKEKYQERISNLFREMGLFVYKGTDSLVNAGFKNIDDSCFEKVYFKRDDFLNIDIENADYNTKHIIFEKCFSKININKNPRPIATYPIGQFILELYNIIRSGMSIDGFKTILYSNWRYIVDKKYFIWSDYISDFKYIEIFLEEKKSISEWIDTLNDIKQVKKNITDNDLYRYHPVAQITAHSIEFFCTLLNELNAMSEYVKGIIGSIDKHLEALKTVVMKADTILNFENDDLEFEQMVVKRLVNAIDDIGSSSLMNTLDSTYFAENIRSMLTDWENQNETEEENELRINVVNLENMKCFKHTYFFMAEADKYPRKYHDVFPFSKDILKILSDEKYGINIRTGEVLGLDYHLKLERYLFKNVLDFSTESITITSAEKEYDKHTRPSIFLYDICAVFGKDIEYIKTRPVAREENRKFINQLDRIAATKKNTYTLTDLAIFKLCPRMYYHYDKDNQRGAFLNKLQLKFYAEAVMYCDLFRRFMEYNLENKKVYRKDETEYKDVLHLLFNQCFDDNIKNFSFLHKYETMDIRRNVAKKMLGFIENGMQYVKSNQFTVITLKNRVYSGNEYELVIEHDNRYVDYINRSYRMSQNSTYLEFLVLKTSDGQSMLKHYAEMIEALNKNDSNEDRINLISRIIAKINIQFNSGKFENDGVERTDNLVKEINEYDFIRAKAMKSEYCNYCRLRDICIGV